MTKAIHHIGEFRHNRRIDRAVVAAEDLNRWQQLAAEFFKYEMLILHLIREACCLEQPLTIPLQCRYGEWGGG